MREVMNLVGLIGGLGWEASAHYYRRINELVNESCGNMTCSSLLLLNLDNRPISQAMYRNQWNLVQQSLAAAVARLEAADVQAWAMACNSVHAVAPQLEQSAKKTLLHIADAVAAEAQQRGHKKLMLLGTSFTLQQGFYQQRLQGKVEIVLPPENLAEEIHRMIYHKLKKGQFPQGAEKRFAKICRQLVSDCDGIILGCTELPLLLQACPGFEQDLYFYDTIELHCRAIVDFMLAPK